MQEQDAPPVRELWEMLELVEEILVRILPDEPACLIRASLACKPWCCLLSGHAFRRRYRTLHKTPPILGFLQSWRDDVERFVPTTSFRPRNLKRRDRFLLDSRHGRVLLCCERDKKEWLELDGCFNLVVWDPTSGSRMELREPEDFPTNYSAAVLCAVEGCDHAACNLGPFSVVYISLDNSQVYVENDEDERHAWAYEYSSETREWVTSPMNIVVGGLGSSIVGKTSVLVGQALYFLVKRDQGLGILKYELDRHCLSVIDLPELCATNPLLVSANDGALAVVNVDHRGLCTMWSVEVSLDGAVSCIQLREMDLIKALLPIDIPTGLHIPKLIGCVEGTDIIIVFTYLGVFTVDLKSLQSRKLSSKTYKYTYLWGLCENLFLYMSFNHPPAVAGVGAEARASEAGRGDTEV